MCDECGHSTQKEQKSLSCRTVRLPVSDIHAESVSVVLITHATASRSTLINEEIIKSIILNSSGAFTARGGERGVEKERGDF